MGHCPSSGVDFLDSGGSAFGVVEAISRIVE